MLEAPLLWRYHPFVIGHAVQCVENGQERVAASVEHHVVPITCGDIMKIVRMPYGHLHRRNWPSHEYSHLFNTGKGVKYVVNQPSLVAQSATMCCVITVCKHGYIHMFSAESVTHPKSEIASKRYVILDSGALVKVDGKLFDIFCMPDSMEMPRNLKIKVSPILYWRNRWRTIFP